MPLLTEVPALKGIATAYGVSDATLDLCPNEVPLLKEIARAVGVSEDTLAHCNTEVPLLREWARAISGSEAVLAIAPNEVPLLKAIAAMLGATEDQLSTANTEVPLLNLILFIVESADSAPVNTVAPVASPVNLFVGALVSVTNGSWTDFPTSYTYEWFADGVAIVGATSSSYTVQAGDIGKVLSCEVTASNSFGPSLPAASNDTNPVVAESSYLRPDGVSTYFRLGGAFLYLRP